MVDNKVVFLDVDGVLNTNKTTERIYDSHQRGIEDQYIEKLKKIIDGTGAKIVLISSWKIFWKEDTHNHMKYLKEKLSNYGLTISDITEDRGDNRGYGILQYVGHNDVNRWAVLDDDVFDDYKVFGILNHLVKVYGLDDKSVDVTIGLLNGRRL